MQCWQYEIKKSKEKDCSGIHPQIDYSDFSIAPIEYGRAKEFILNYEWVGNMGTSKYCFGLLFKDILAAVVCYGPPVAPSRYKKLLGPDVSDYVLQLCRGATTFWAPKWGPSKLISSTLRYLGNELGTLAVIAYADPEAGEIGTIYQACNAIYIGKTSLGGSKKYVIHGHQYDPRKVQKKFGSRSHEHILSIDPQYNTVPQLKKHRYLFFTGPKKSKRELIKRIQNVIEPYPKRNFTS